VDNFEFGEDDIPLNLWLMTQLTVIPVHVGFGNSETTDVCMLKVVFRLNEC
jgi:hypothetical protein